MNTSMLKRVRRHFQPGWNTTRAVARHNQRAWVRSVRALGDRWLLAQKVRRPETPDRGVGAPPF